MESEYERNTRLPLINPDGSPAEVPEHVAAGQLAEHLEEERQDLLGTVRSNRAESDKRWDMTPEEVAYFTKLPIDPMRTLHDDIVWVSNVIDLPVVPLEKIPSVRARSLLLWSKENRNEFYKNTLPAAEKQRLQSAKDGADDTDYDRDEFDRVLDAELQDMLRALVQDAQQIEVDPTTGLIEYPERARKRREN